MTMGDRGAWFSKRISCFFMNPISSCCRYTGAGDTFCGFFIAGLAEGLDWNIILERSSAAAAIAVSRAGAAQSVPCKEEVNTFLEKV